jgi:ankyrin repeat protein
VNQNGWTPLNTAANNGHIDVMKLLLENGADVTVANQNGWTPLNSAAGNGHFNVVMLLLEKGAC